MKPLSVVSIGRLYCDLNFHGIGQLPQLGQEVFADSLTLHAGGGAFITASYLVSLGCQAKAMGTMPGAPFQSIVESEASNNGISLEYCEVATPSEPQLTVAMSLSGDRAFMTRRPGDALPANYKDSIRSFGNTAGTKHLHIAELSTLLAHPDLITLARENDLTVSLDCGWDESSFGDSSARELIAGVDLFMPNELEIARLKEHGIDEFVAPVTVVKQGVDGASAYTKERACHTANADKVEVVDTIGAGDAFNAGFIVAWLRESSLPRCLGLGNRCGAIAVSLRGGATTLPHMGALVDQYWARSI